MKKEIAQAEEMPNFVSRLLGISGVLLVHALSLLILTSFLIHYVLETYAFSDEQDILIPAATEFAFEYSIKTAKWWYVFVPAVLLCDFLVLFGLTSNLFKSRRLYHGYSVMFLLFTVFVFYLFAAGSSLAVKSFRGSEKWDALAGRQKAERLLAEGRYRIYQTYEEELANPLSIDLQLRKHNISLYYHEAIVNYYPTYVAAFNAKMLQAIEDKYGKGFLEQEIEKARRKELLE